MLMPSKIATEHRNMKHEGNIPVGSSQRLEGICIPPDECNMASLVTGARFYLQAEFYTIKEGLIHLLVCDSSWASVELVRRIIHRSTYLLFSFYGFHSFFFS